MTCSVRSCVINSPLLRGLMSYYSAPGRLEVEHRIFIAADLLDLRYDLAVERRHIGPVDLDEVARRIAQIHLDGTVWQLTDTRVTSAVPHPQPAHRPGEVGRRDLLHPEEVRVEADRLLQVGGADADVGEPSRPHADAPYSGIMETVFHDE